MLFPKSLTPTNATAQGVDVGLLPLMASNVECIRVGSVQLPAE